MQLGNILLQEHVFIAANLSMTEAVGAEGETILGGGIEHQLALRVLVLASFEKLNLPFTVYKPGLIKLLVAVMRIGLLGIFGYDPHPLLITLGINIGLGRFWCDHAGLGQYQLIEGVVFVVVPVDTVQRVAGGQEKIHFNIKFTLLDLAELNAVFLEDLADPPKPIKTGVIGPNFEQK